MNRKRKMLIAIVLVALMLLNCVAPMIQVDAATDTKITFESNLYTALRNALLEQEIKAAYIDEQRTIIISDEEIAKVTELSLSNSKISDLTGLEVFKNLSILDLSSNELNKDSNLAVLDTFNLSMLDLSSNAIEDVSMITKLDDIPNLNLHNQKMNIVHIVELDTSNESDQITEVTYALPEILKRAGYLETEWLVEERTGQAKINWSQFDHENVKVQVAQKTDSSYTPYKSMVTLRIRVSDSTNTLYNSDINIFFIVVDSDERGIHIIDKNMYNAVKAQLTSGQTVNSDLISYYYTTPSSLRRNLYERAYAEPQVLVISIDDIINRIGSLDLSNKQIERLDGIEKFVGLETELDLSGNYIKSIDKLIELQQNQILEESKLRERVSKQLGLVSETVSKINGVETSLKAQNEILKGLLEKKAEIEANIEKLQEELAKLRDEKAQLEEKQIDLTDEIEALEAEVSILQSELEGLNNELNNEKAALSSLQDEKNTLEKELADLKDQLTKAESGNDEIKARISAKENEIKELENSITNKIADIANKQAEVDSKMQELKAKEDEIDSKQTTIAIYDTQISDVTMSIVEKEEEYERLLQDLEETALDSMVTTDEQIARRVNDHIEEILSIVNTKLIISFKDSNGRAISNANIEIRQGDTVFGNYTTDENGLVIIEEMPNGSYNAKVTYNLDETTTVEKTVELAIVENLVFNLDLNLTEENSITVDLQSKELSGIESLEERRNELEEFERGAYAPINEQMQVIAELIAEKELTEENVDIELDVLRSRINSVLDVWNDRIAKNNEQYQYNNTARDTLRVKSYEDYLYERIADLENKAANSTIFELKLLVLDLNNQLIENMPEIDGLIAERDRLQAEIDKLNEEIAGTQDSEGLAAEKDALEKEVTDLVAERDALTEQKQELEAKLKQAREDLVNLNEELKNSEATRLMEQLKIQISEKEKEIAVKVAEIEEKERDVVAAEEKVTAKQKEIEEKQAQITEKQTQMDEAKKALEEKETEIQNKIAEIAKVVEELNTQREGIVEVELKIAELQAELSELYTILYARMNRLYTIYNRVDKLASFATSDLKTITAEEYLNLTYDEAKSMFNAQVSKIANIEDDLTSFELDYLLDKYSIPTTTSVEVEKTFVNEDGSTYTQMVTESKPIENPVSTYFNELASATEEWNLSDFKSYLTNFREDDTYFSMATYCYLVRLFEGITVCQATKYIDIEIEKYEFDEEPTYYLENAKANYNSIINKYGYSCSGTATVSSMLKQIASRMVKASGDINVYVTLPRLKSINVNENLIENIDKISELTELRRFYAYDNEIVDISNVNWASMTKLKVLNLGFNGIDDIKPLEVLVNIEELYLQKNLIAGEFDFNVHVFENLRVLDLSENQINDIEKLIKFLTFEARANGYSDIATFLRNSGKYNVKFNNQRLSMIIDEKFEVNENRKVELPKIFRQIEEIDYANTSFGINSLDGNVTSDGKYVILNTTKEGTHDAQVSIINTKSTTSFGYGTTCDIVYTVGDIVPVTVKVTPETAEVLTGKTQQFTAEVTGDKVTYTGVTWEVTNASSEETKISSEGLLTIGSDETAEELVVKATSLYDETKSAEVKVKVVKKQLTNITLTPETATIFKGESAVFTANVEGENLEDADKEVEWEVFYQPLVDSNGQEIPTEPAEGSKFDIKDNTLTLTIADNEEIATFMVKATSKFDTTKVAESSVTIDERIVSEVKITPENISVEKGKTQNFTATVNGEDLRTEDKTVTYTVTGNTSNNTKITKEGLLTVGADEKAKTIKVVATSNYDETKSAEATVEVTSPVENNVLGYTVDEEYIVGVATKTPVDAFKTKLTKDYTVVVKEDGKEVTTGYMKTGMYVELQDAEGNTVENANGDLLVYEVVVKGDVNKDGIADALDSNLIKALRNEVITVDAVQEKAADIDNNKEIDLLDSKLLLYHRAEVKNYCLDYTK